MSRITKHNLEIAIHRLNVVSGNPTEPWTKDDDGKFRANIGNYHLDGAYGGWKFVQTMNEGGGINNTINMGFESKKVCYELLTAYIAGIETHAK